MRFAALATLLLLPTAAWAQTEAIAERHLEQSLVYAASGKKVEAEVERKSAIDAFDAALTARGSDVVEYLRIDCRGLLEKSVVLLRQMNEVGSEVQDLFLHHMSGQVGDKIEPLAEKYRRLETEYIFDLVAIIHIGGCSSQSVDQTKFIISRRMELAGVSAFYSDNGALRAMPMKNPPPLPAPKPALEYPVPPTMFPTPLPAAPQTMPLGRQ